AGVLRLDDRDFLRARLQAIGDAVQDAGPVRLAHARPGAAVERGPGRLDRALRVLAPGTRHPRPGLLGGRVDRVDRLAGLRRPELAVDVELILLHGNPPWVNFDVVPGVAQPVPWRQCARQTPAVDAATAPAYQSRAGHEPRRLSLGGARGPRR